MMYKKLFSALCLSSLLAMSACSSSDDTSDANPDTEVFDPRGDTWDIGPIDDPTAHSDATFYGDSATSGTACLHGTGLNSVGDATCTWVVTDNVNIEITCPSDTGTVTVYASAFAMDFADDDTENDLAFGDYMQGASIFTTPQGVELSSVGWDGKRSGGDVIACVVE